MGKTRQAEHQAFIDWLVGQVVAQAVDVVLVAGDVFDTGAPPSYARELFNHGVVALYEAGAQLVVIGGNHDSVATLGEGRAVLAHLNARVVPGAAEPIDDEVLELRTRDGRVGAILCAVPYLRPREVQQSRAGQSAEDKQQSLQDAIRAHYLEVYRLACLRRDAAGGGLPIVASGHLLTVGASASEAVREIYVGSLEAFPTQAFPPADYIALGHIHRPQKVGGQDAIRYCGSPIPLGFDEARQDKEVLLVDLDAGGLRAVTPLTVPRFQALASVRGTLEQLPDAIRAAADGACAERPLWLEVAVRTDDYLADLHGRVLALCAGLPVELLRLRRERDAVAPAMQRRAGETLDELTPDEVFARRLEGEEVDAELGARLSARFRDVVASLHEASA